MIGEFHDRDSKRQAAINLNLLSQYPLIAPASIAASLLLLLLKATALAENYPL